MFLNHSLSATHPPTRKQLTILTARRSNQHMELRDLNTLDDDGELEMAAIVWARRQAHLLPSSPLRHHFGAVPDKLDHDVKACSWNEAEELIAWNTHFNPLWAVSDAMEILRPDDRHSHVCSFLREMVDGHIPLPEEMDDEVGPMDLLPIHTAAVPVPRIWDILLILMPPTVLESDACAATWNAKTTSDMSKMGGQHCNRQFIKLLAVHSNMKADQGHESKTVVKQCTYNLRCSTLMNHIYTQLAPLGTNGMLIERVVDPPLYHASYAIFTHLFENAPHIKDTYWKNIWLNVFNPSMYNEGVQQHIADWPNDAFFVHNNRYKFHVVLVVKGILRVNVQWEHYPDQNGRYPIRSKKVKAESFSVREAELLIIPKGIFISRQFIASEEEPFTVHFLV